MKSIWNAGINNTVDRKPIQRFVHLVAAVEDTPSIIRRIAENRRFLSCCLAAVKAENNTDPELLRLYHDLKTEIGRQGCSFDGIMEKLSPAAAALGLQPDTPDSIHADYYWILGISPTADAEAVKKAYRRKAMRSHPDARTGENGRFMAVHEAYSVLSDPASRRFYDLRRQEHLHRKWSEHTGNGEDRVPNKRFSGVFRSYGLPWGFILLLFLGIIAAADFVVQQHSLQEDMYAATSPKTVSSEPIDPQSEKPPQASPSPLHSGSRADRQTGRPSAYRSDPSHPSMTHIQKRHAQIAMYEKAIRERHRPQPPARDKKTAAETARVTPLPSPPAAVAPKKGGKQPAAEKKLLSEPSASPLPAEKAAQKIDNTADGEFSEKRGDTQRRIMTERLKQFLSGYCSAYENLDLDRFLAFFAPGATENGTPLRQLVPKYKTNFSLLDSMHYTILLGDWVMDSNRDRIELEGHFSLRWQKKADRRWHRRRGKIQMNLAPRQDTFAVEELTYQFTE